MRESLAADHEPLRFPGRYPGGRAENSYQSSRVRNTAARQILGESRAIVLLKHTISQFAKATANVIVIGETGTGKELVARAIHEQSGRAETGAFIGVNCGAIPQELMEHEFFGSKRGAFTGSIETKRGLVEAADKGTLFLDEIDSLPLAMQVKLLRVLQEREVKKVGDTNYTPVDFRVVAATNANLKDLVAQGKFREDLYYRLNVLTIQTPPLREHPEDIPILVNCIIRRICSSHPSSEWKTLNGPAYDKLMQYKWPGNVRELENVVERSVWMAEKNTLGPSDLVFGVRGSVYIEPAQPVESTEGLWELTLPDEGIPLLELERRAILIALRRCDGVVQRAAKYLGIPRTCLYHKMKSVHKIEWARD